MIRNRALENRNQAVLYIVKFPESRPRYKASGTCQEIQSECLVASAGDWRLSIWKLSSVIEPRTLEKKEKMSSSEEVRSGDSRPRLTLSWARLSVLRDIYAVTRLGQIEKGNTARQAHKCRDLSPFSRSLTKSLSEDQLPWPRVQIKSPYEHEGHLSLSFSFLLTESWTYFDLLEISSMSTS